MKKFYLACVLAVFAGKISSQAQTYTITPNDTVVVTAPYYTITIFDIYQNNNSGAPLNLAWTLVANNLVPGWDFSLCDYTTCYTGLPANGTMVTVPDSGQGFLGLNVDPVNISGTGVVRIYVYDVNFPSNGDTLTWIVSTPPVGMADPSFNPAAVQMYPNPANDVLYVNPGSGVQSPSQIVVFDLAGRQVAEGTMSASGIYAIDVAALPEGNYIMEYRLESGLNVRRPFIKTAL